MRRWFLRGVVILLFTKCPLSCGHLMDSVIGKTAAAWGLPPRSIYCRCWDTNVIVPTAGRIGLAHECARHLGLITSIWTTQFYNQLAAQCFIFSIQSSYILRSYILAIFRERQVWSTCTVCMAPYTLYTSTKLVAPCRWPGYTAETCRSFV
jgi:hypothetical protein